MKSSIQGHLNGALKLAESQMPQMTKYPLLVEDSTVFCTVPSNNSDENVHVMIRITNKSGTE